MTRMFAVLAAALALLVAPGVAGATHSNGKGPSHDLVAGTGQIVLATAFGTFDLQLHVNATSAPDGSDPRGHFFAHVEGGFIAGDFSGDVTCLRVEGSEVVVGGQVARSTIPLLPPGSRILAMGVDHGEGEKDPVDTVIGIPIIGVGPPITLCPQPFTAGAPIESGNFTAHDAS